MIKNASISILLAFAAFYNGRPVFAEEILSKDFFDVKLFSLSKRSEDAFDAAAAVYVVTAEDIRRSGASGLPDVLRMVPGLHVSQQGGHNWAISARGFATQFTNKLLVLVDGRAIYKPLFSGVFWDAEDMPLQNIDRIEVIRGPGGTIWGSNAVNGVINIITKKASVMRGNHIIAEVDNRGGKTISATHGGVLDDGGEYRVHVHSADRPSEFTVDGQSAGDSWKTYNAGFRYDTTHRTHDTVTIQADIKDTTSDGYFLRFPSTTAPFVINNPLQKNQKHFNILTKWNHKINHASSLQTQLYFDYDRLRSGIVNWNGYTFDADIQHHFQYNPTHTFTSGLGVRYLINQQQNPSTFITYQNTNRRDTLLSFFLQDKVMLIPDAMFFTIGSKLEHNNITGFEYQPSVRLTYYPDDNQTLWASITRAVRTPSVGEEDAIIKVAGTPGGFISRNFENGYESEELIAYEMGYRTIPYDQLLLEGTVFYNVYDKLRTLEPGSAFGDIIASNGTRNNGEGYSYGVELNSKLQVGKKWRLRASYSYMHTSLSLNPGATDSTFLTQEDQTPTHQFNFNSYYNILPSLEFDNSLYYSGKIVSFTQSQPINEYFRLDSRLGWRVSENIEISIIGRNLLDDRHQESQPSLYSVPKEIGRSFLVRFSLTL